MDLYFGVDIGNSGIRVAVLRPAEALLGDMLRITWEQAGECSRLPGQNVETRFSPHDRGWLQQVEQFLTEQIAAVQSTGRLSPKGADPLAPGDSVDPLQHHWLISSVRRDAQQVLVDYLQSSERNNLRIIDFRSLPLKINLEYPERVGIDRLLAAFAASEVTDERPLIVIQAGSAVTVDLVDALGQGGTISDSAISFEGGAILPGVPMMLRLLGKGADMLPEIDADDLMELPSLPGRNTEQAMLCGAASGLIGGVQHLVRRYREAYGASIPVILSGGDGMRLSPYIDQPMTVVPHLVQRGLLKLLESPD